jgi:hypothetical protein
MFVNFCVCALVKHVFEMNFVILALYGVFLLISKYVLGLGFDPKK